MKQGKKQKFSRLLALLLAFVMVFTMMPGMAWAEDSVVKTISSENDFPAEIATGETYELTTDIELTEGKQIETLAGVLDGKGHTITLSGKPLAVNVSGTIQNLGVRGSVTTSDLSSEGVLAITLDGGIIQNSYSVASITGGKYADVGGIAGTLKNNAVVRNCFFAGDGTPGQYATVGGISVYANGTNTISNCFYIEGSITAYRSDDTTKENCDIKTADEFKSANMAILLNNNIEPTGYIWQFIEGESYPTLVEGVITQTVDKSGLEAAINKAEALIESDYVAESWQPFKIVLESAKAVYNSEEATQSDVNTATNNLETSVNSLEKKKPTEPVAPPIDSSKIIHISNQENLQSITSSGSKNNYYVLDNDIILDSFYGNGYDSVTFDGVFDGQGYTVTFGGGRSTGLFTTVGPNGIIQNVHFEGTIDKDYGAVAREVQGTVLNCYSEISGSLSSGFAKRLNGGVLSNCYSISNASKGVVIETANETYKGTLNNVYWMNGLNNTEILVDGTILTFTGYTGGCSMEYMQSMDLVDLLNENRDTYGSEWGQSSSGYPYFGENQEFTSGGANLPANKTTVAFKPAKGAESAVENQQLIVDKNVLNETGFAGTFSLPEYVVPEGAKVQWECTQQSIDGVAAVSLEDDEWGNKGGELAVYREGSFVITATLVKADETTELLASVRVTTFVSKIEDIELYIIHGDSNDAELIENDSVTATGSEDLQIVIRAKYTGETVYRPISGSGFNIEITAEEGAIKQMSGSSIFSFTQPGKTATVTVTNKQDSSITKTFTATSTYVPVTSITPGISGTITIHHRNSNMDESEFLHIKGSVNVSPSNASFSGGYTVTSSDETIGKYHASSGEFVPLKAGEVTYIATIDDNGSKSGESIVTFVYANPLKSVSVANDNLAVKKNASISAGLVFEGTNEGYNDVSEAGMTWSFDQEGIISISRESGGWKQGEGEQNTGYFNSNEYLIYGLSEGTVKVTGTPVDTTGGAVPVTFTVTVTEGDPEVAADNAKIIKEGIELAQGYLQKNNASKDFKFGDEWLVFILERSGSTIDPAKLEKYVESVGAAYANPAGDTLKPTTIARTILALEAIGEDATDVDGVNLVEKLYSSNQITNGGNEAMWALIALDAVDFELPDTAAWTREELIEEVLAYQSANGGFAWASKTGEPDVDTTAMAIQALAPYNTEDYPDVQTAITEALEYLKVQMNVKCQYSTGSESSAQVLIAVSALGKDVLAEENGFVKSVARNLITGLNEYKVEGKGFKHVISATEENAYATLQALQGFEAYRRFADNEKALYDLSDVSAANALAKRIAEAEALDESNYHEGLWADLKIALTEAKRVAADEDATEEQIKTADVALAAAIAALLESNPTPGVAADDINVYVTIAVKGELATGKDGSVIGDAKVTVVDRNSDGKHTVDEVLYAAHEKYYPDGAAEGYGSVYGSHGLSMTKLWGDTSGAYGYWYNNGSCWSLDDTVIDNGYLTAFIYKDAGWSDSYSKFDSETYSTSINTSVGLKLEKAGYDASWNTVFSACEGAKIKVIGETSSRTSTDSSGNASVSFDKAGIYKVVAYSEDGLLVPSVVTITVTDPSVPKEKVYLSVVNPSGSTYLSKTAYDFELGQTALSILLNSGLDVVTQYYAVYGSHYVKSIEGLGEFDGGAQSGWMYKVNGDAPDYGASLYKLKAGDYVEWLYTKNLGADIGAGKEEEKEEVTTVGGGAGATGEVTTTTPTEVTVIGSTATATVTKENVTETIRQVTENKSAEIVLQVSASDSKGASNVKVQLDTATVKDVVNKTEAVLTVKTENAEVSLDRETLKTVAAEAAGSTVTLEVIEVAAPTAAHKEVAGENGHIIQLVIKSGTKTISLFNEGKATVTVEIPSKLTGKKVAAIHIGDDGKIEHLKGQEITENGKKHYRFDTPHFSTFALVDADEIGLEVEEQTMSAEEVKELIADLSPIARSSKTAKKNIKVTLKLDAADKAIIEQLEDEGYTVKYNFYRSTKKSSKYSSRLIKDTASYTQTGGKKGTKYYYKARVQVYDAEGKLIARTELKQCKYACRKWTK